MGDKVLSVDEEYDNIYVILVSIIIYSIQTTKHLILMRKPINN